MTDVFSPAKRSEIMRAVVGKQTAPERRVVEIVRRMGFRPALNVKELRGCPDLVFHRRRKAVFVHGCFWHRHRCTAGVSMPSSNQSYWRQKFERNKTRDAAIRRQLRKAGWSVLVVWECQTKPPATERLAVRLKTFLSRPRMRPKT